MLLAIKKKKRKEKTESNNRKKNIKKNQLKPSNRATSPQTFVYKGRSIGDSSPVYLRSN